MKLLIDISGSLFERIKNLVESGGYSSVSDFFLAAAENQLLIEKTQAEGPMDISSMRGKSSRDTVFEVNSKELLTPQKELVKTVDMPSDNQLIYRGKKADAEMYLWGQINRIFPMKIGLRVLANMLVGQDDYYLNLEDYGTKASQIAQTIRNALVHKTEHITGKKDSLWAGLPNEKSKSVVRFKGQFLAYLRADDIIEGSLGKLKFANLIKKDNKMVLIGITKPGLEFSSLENPILDRDTYNNGSLSAAEKDFYLQHIVSHVPYETNAFIDILKLLSKGITSLSALNDELTKIWPSDWSADLINTQRNGIISRLVELGLVEKIKKGIEVEYKITENGSNFLRNPFKQKTSEVINER